MGFGIIDRFEGEYAIVEFDRVMQSIKRSDIVAEAREGDAIVWDNNHWVVDRERTDKLKREIHDLADELFK